ncbi:MAG TPA: hypothetical protein VGH80_06595, partial [Xanthomonadaceae bacterium]
MNNLRKTTLALAVVTAFCATGASAATGTLTAAHSTFMRQGDAVVGAMNVAAPIHFHLGLAIRDKAGLDAYI